MITAAVICLILAIILCVRATDRWDIVLSTMLVLLLLLLGGLALVDDKAADERPAALMRALSTPPPPPVLRAAVEDEIGAVCIFPKDDPLVVNPIVLWPERRVSMTCPAARVAECLRADCAVIYVGPKHAIWDVEEGKPASTELRMFTPDQRRVP